MAQSLHNAHPERKNGPFVAVNCAALNDQLLESELFGYEPGMFTGAQKQAKPGLFELAHGGTIFLDEIGKVSMDLQDKLLRVIQEREIRRIGGERNIPIDVRVIAAVNDDIHELIEKEKFRSDLYYRLEVLVLPIPPLRDRIEDIPDLVNFMLKKICPQIRQARCASAGRPDSPIVRLQLAGKPAADGEYRRTVHGYGGQFGRIVHGSDPKLTG